MSEHARNRPPCREVLLSPERFEIVLGSISDGVFAVDADQRIICFNRAAEQTLGVTREEVLGAWCADVLKAPICDQACPLRFTMETGRPVVNLALDFHDAHGRRIPVTISTAVIQGAAGEIVGGVVTFRDLTLVRRLLKDLDDKDPFREFVSTDPHIKHLFDILPTIAESDSNVLIEGETGTGKSLLARVLHRLSGRRAGPMITVNCGAMPETLLESELFGYRAGAFTGAIKDRRGRIAAAEGGTLLLDEIGDLPMSMQVKLLRLLQDRVYEPLGVVEPVAADVRVVAATNRDLMEMVAERTFRRDLFYRLNVIRLSIPPLRDRLADVPLLAQRFVEELSMLRGKVVTTIEPEALEALSSCDYPGNVRQLHNAVEHAFVLTPGATIRREHLPPEILGTTTSPGQGAGPRLERFEATIIREALERNHWSRTAAAQELGVHKTTLLRKIRRLAIDLPPVDGRSSKRRRQGR